MALEKPRLKKSILDDPRALTKHLKNHGWNYNKRLTQNELEKLSESIDKYKKETIRSGWHRDKHVSQHGTLGVKGYMKNANIIHCDYEETKTRGSVEQFLPSLQEVAIQAPIITFSYIAALVPALASRIGLTGGFAIFYSGESSTGKTTITRFIQSIFAKASSGKDLVSFTDTIGALNEQHYKWGGQAVAFDDIKGSSEHHIELAQKIIKIVFRVESGKLRKTRFNINDSTKEPDYCTIVLSTELPLNKLFEECNFKFQDGEAARWMEIPIPNRSDKGIFEKIDHGLDNNLYIAKFEKLISTNYGAVGVEWIKYLAANKPKKSLYEGSVNRFLKNTVLISTESSVELQDTLLF